MTVIKMLALLCVLPSLFNIKVNTPTKENNNKSSKQIFKPLAKYIVLADIDKLSVWFDNNLEITILSKTNNCSKEQAIPILKDFFKSNKPRHFEIVHTAGDNKIRYAIGSLETMVDKFNVSLVLNIREDGYQIKIIKITRQNI